MTIHTPSGLAFNSPVKFEQSNSRFASAIFWAGACTRPLFQLNLSRC